MKKILCTFFIAFLLVFSLFLLKDFNDSISKKEGEIVYFEYNFLNHHLNIYFLKFLHQTQIKTLNGVIQKMKI